MKEISKNKGTFLFVSEFLMPDATSPAALILQPNVKDDLVSVGIKKLLASLFLSLNNICLSRALTFWSSY